MVAGRYEDGHGHLRERYAHELLRLRPGGVAVEEVAGEQHELAVFARAQLGEGAQQLALLAAAQRRLLLPEGVEGRIQVQVRRVEHTYHRNLTALTAVQRPVFSSRVKSAPSSLTGPPAHS